MQSCSTYTQAATGISASDLNTNQNIVPSKDSFSFPGEFRWIQFSSPFSNSTQVFSVYHTTRCGDQALLLLSSLSTCQVGTTYLCVKLVLEILVWVLPTLSWDLAAVAWESAAAQATAALGWWSCCFLCAFSVRVHLWRHTASTPKRAPSLWPPAPGPPQICRSTCCVGPGHSPLHDPADLTSSPGHVVQFTAPASFITRASLAPTVPFSWSAWHWQPVSSNARWGVLSACGEGLLIFPLWFGTMSFKNQPTPFSKIFFCFVLQVSPLGSLSDR